MTPAARTRTIRAAVLRAAGRPMRVESLTLSGPRPDEVLVRLAACGVCHTDIGFWEQGADWPVVLGHEGAGVVQEAGARVRGLAPGDHVLLTFQSCGLCAACRDQRPAHCENFWEANFGFCRLDGSNALGGGVRGHFFGQSSFASHCLATERNAVKVDPDLPLDILAPLGCGMQTGAGAVLNSLAARPGQSVLVLGAGAVGLAAVMAAVIAGADPIIAVDLLPQRLALARDLGATHAFADGPDLGRRVAEATGGGADCVVESAGDPGLLRRLPGMLRPGSGRAALLSGAQGPGDLPDGRRIFDVIQGDALPQRFLPELVAHYRAGRFPLDRLIGRRPLAEINEAMADSLSGRVVKPVLLLDEARP